MQKTFYDYNWTDTQPIATTSTTCNFTYIGIACTLLDKNPSFFHSRKLGKQENSPYFRLLMTLDELKTRLSGQCINTVQYLAELHFGQDIEHGQGTEEQGAV